MTPRRRTVLTREDVFYQAVNCYFGSFGLLVGYNRFLAENPKFSMVCAVLGGLFLLLSLILTIASFRRTPPNWANHILQYAGPGIDTLAAGSIIISFMFAVSYFPSKPFLFHLFFYVGYAVMITLLARNMYISLRQVRWYRANVVRALKSLALLTGLFVLILVPIDQLSIKLAVSTLAAGLVLLVIAVIIEVCKVE